MDIRKIKKLIDLIDETGVSEIEIKEGEESVRISRQMLMQGSAPMMQYMSPAPAPAAPASKPEETTSEKPKAIATPVISAHTLKSPMVGTTYLSPSPGAKPFVEVGQRVEVGAIVCLIEAMKMYNQIEADKAGVISARLIENGQPVEFDQPLFIIE
jgi:acetyl-CoA carboxylase biotin carboxyl carrier protein